MTWHRGIDGSEPLRAEPIERVGGPQEERRASRTGRLAGGTLACPACDAPVAAAGVLTPVQPLACPVCLHGGTVRDFLSLAFPARPAHVEVRVVDRVGLRARR